MPREDNKIVKNIKPENKEGCGCGGVSVNITHKYHINGETRRKIVARNIRKKIRI